MEGFKPKPLDIWAFGVSLYAYVTQKLPFYNTELQELERMIREDEPQYPDDMSPNLKDLLERIFEKDPEKRICIEGILRHKWMEEPPELGVPEFKI